MPRRPDTVKVEIIGDAGVAGVLDNFTSLEITQDITMPMEASFELGNDGTWEQIQNRVAPGTQYRIVVNDRPMLTGRVELNDIPTDPSAGSVVRFMVRSKLSDAVYASAAQSISVKNTTLDRFIFSLYAPLGFTEDDFDFRAARGRDLRTGRRTDGKGDDIEVKLSQLKVDEARVKPPESIFAAADRHLRRFGLMHWDGPDGKIVVGFPDNAQDPIYRFFNFRNSERSRHNNTTGFSRAQDFSGIPSHVGVFGFGGRRSFSRSRARGLALDLDVLRAGFNRPVAILAEGIRNDEAATNAAFRELAARRKQKDVVNIETDGLSHWDGQSQTNYGVDTMAQIETDVSGGNLGAYYVHRVQMRRDAENADMTNLSMTKRGLWVLFPEVFEGRLTG